ncbi:MAG: class I adenylate-forming enzyme family protein [Caldimonas sp.]
MQQFLDSPLAAAPAHLDRPAVVDANRTWTWRQVHEASVALSRRLEEASAVCNLCTSRAGFLITCLATLRNRCLMILPPSGSSADLAAVMKAEARPVAVGDPEAWPEPGCGDRLEAGSYVCWHHASNPTAAGEKELAWQPPWDEIAVLLHTSGSTGAPQPQPKTLRHLAMGALVLGARLAKDVEGGPAAIGRIICSVPPQHMYGLECSVLLPLVYGMPVHEGRPLLPADVRAAFAGSQPGAWIATPMHLRSLVQSAERVPSCSVVIVSTMPLTRAVARQSELLVQAPVLEIYGSTETGALAMRRTARDMRWLPMDGVQLECADGATVGRGSHFASPVRLLDEVALDANGSFTLLGRRADLIKIAGHRASLAGLNLLLQDLPGLEDGVLYLPATGNPTERLCLIHSGPPLDRAAARRWLRARIDPVFLPRTFIRVERLPRSDNGKLRRQMLDLVYAEWLSAAQPAPGRRRAAAKDPAECS